MKLFVLLLALIPFVSAAEDEVLWDYDLHTLPPEWHADVKWTFSSEGANLDVSYGGSSGSSGGTLGSLDTFVVLPEGIDSLIITADQSLGLSGYNDYSEAGVYISLNQGTSWVKVFYMSSPGGTSEPLHICLSSIAQPGLPFQIKFTGTAYGSIYGGSSMGWTLENLLVTAYGDGLVLEQWTWGEIKQLQ